MLSNYTYEENILVDAKKCIKSDLTDDTIVLVTEYVCYYLLFIKKLILEIINCNINLLKKQIKHYFFKFKRKKEDQ